MSPPSWNASRYESYMVPSMASFSRPKSIVPSTWIFSEMIGKSGDGMLALISPRIASRIGSGTSRMTPTSRSSSVGVPQPIENIGPNRYRPCCGGKNDSISLTIFVALATGSGGNRMSSRRVRAQPGLQRVDHHRAVDPAEPADPIQGEAHARAESAGTRT